MSTMEQVRPPPWREVFRGARGRLTAGLLLLESLLAIEALVVVTILPAIERDLGGLSLYGWTFTALTLASLGSVPIAGRLTDRLGPRKVLGYSVVLYVVGLGLAAAAPSMLVVVLARGVQGIGAGGLYTVSLAAVAKTYPERIRPRVMALLASMWILPGLLGPPIGTLLATTVGWRWAFLGPIPVIVLGMVMVMSSLQGTGATNDDEETLPVVASLRLMLGAGLFLAGLTVGVSWVALLLVPVGLVIGLPGLSSIVPSGTLLARRGLPAAALAAFLASVAFLAVDGFLTLMLVKVRGLSIGMAGLVITAASIAWAAGSWWQSRTIARFGARMLVTIGALILSVGTVLVAAGLVQSLPIVIAYVGWGLGGLGMGIVFPTIPLAVMSEAAQGREAGELSSTILMDFLGVGLGAGLGNASVALADAGRISLEAGIAGAFGIGLLAALLLALAGRRIPDARG